MQARAKPNWLPNKENNNKIVFVITRYIRIELAKFGNQTQQSESNGTKLGICKEINIEYLEKLQSLFHVVRKTKLIPGSNLLDQ